MKIAIIDQPYCNRGDESAHKAFVRQLVKALPGSSFDVFCRTPNYYEIEDLNVNIDNVRYLNLNLGRFYSKIIRYTYYANIVFLSYLYRPLYRFKKLLKQYDYIIGAPGGMNMGGFRDWLHLWFFETAYRLKKPVLYWGRSIGPFNEKDCKSVIFKKHSLKLLDYFSYISLRDRISVNCAVEMGIKAEETIDSAFLECPNATIPCNVMEKINSNDYVVYVPNELTWHPHFPKSLQQRIDNFYVRIIDMINNEYPRSKIVMLPQTYKSVINDYSYFKRLRDISQNGHIVVIDENQNSDIQQKIIAGAKLVIGARYHSIVFAINNSIPFISLSYEHKMKGLLDELSMSSCLVEIQDIFNDDLKVQHCISDIRQKMLLAEPSIQAKKQAHNIAANSFEKFVRQITKKCKRYS